MQHHKDLLANPFCCKCLAQSSSKQESAMANCAAEMDSPALALAGKALRVCRAADNVLGQELEVSTTEKLDVDIDNASTLLDSGELCFEFRYNNSTAWNLLGYASTCESSSFTRCLLCRCLSQFVTCGRTLAQSEGSVCLYGSLLLHSIMARSHMCQQ